MEHLGDIIKISGYTAPTVDCVIGGSPCQDLSVAGKRAGLDGERSGLFMEQLRIIKEMRENDARKRPNMPVRPRHMVWENVPGAFSSNKGEDFRIVLEEVARISEEGVTIPRPPKGKWQTTGVIVGDNFSIAWRVFDAQHWGVPQRRRRICLVADFNGHSASEILFNEAKHIGSTKRGDGNSSVGYTGDESRSEVQSFCEGLSSDIESCSEEREGTSEDTEICFGTSDNRPSISFQERGGKPGGGKGILIQKDHVGALSTLQNQYVLDSVFCLQGNGIDRDVKQNGNCYKNDKSYTINTVDRHGVAYAIDMGGGKSACGVFEEQTPTLTCTHGGNPAVVYDGRGNGNGNIVPTMTGDHQNRVTDYTGIVCYRKQSHPRSSEEGQGYEETDKCDTLNVFDNSETRTPTIVVEMDRAAYNQGKNAKFDIGISEDGVAHTVIAKGPGAVAYIDTTHADDVVRVDDKVSPLQARDYKGGKYVVSINGDVSGTIDASYHKGRGMREGKERDVVCVDVDCRNCTEHSINGSLQSNMSHSLNCNNVVRVRYIVRRLTPLERERLQGFPDGWTDIGEYTDSKGKKRKTSDASRYKALGNSIALPSWKFVLKRICANYERPATMASLFDGIGGFPLIWEQINGKGSCLWASEIEEFPMAVTKERIG